MDDLNNNNGLNNNDSFGEESFAETEKKAENPQMNQQTEFDPYNQPAANPYNQQQNDTQQNFDPYKQPQPNYNPNGAGSYNTAYSQPYGNPVMPNGTYPTGLAVASMVIGIISIMSVLFMFIFPPLFILPIIGIILGAVYKSKHYPVGKGMSTAGIVTSIVSLVLALAFLVISVVIVMSIAGDGGMSSLMQMIKDYSPEMYETYYNQYYSTYPEWFEGVSALFRNIAALFIK